MRGRRGAVAIAAVTAFVALTGCSLTNANSAGATSGDGPSPAGGPPGTDSANTPPSAAALAGGACLLMNFDTVRTELGTAFTVSAAADSSGSFTCVLQGTSGSYPSLTLTITATDLTTSDFTAQVVPDGAKAVPELGKIAYEIQMPATKSAGPAIDVGWLSGNNRLIDFRYVCAAGTSTATAAALIPKMVSLSKIVDQTTM
ncbi:MAG TPA: hypothetical protein VFR11_03465 [Micromonosporaceae bacterium]|jgi:hypothetical protein|nr:hypothetical protein [Micromonosporaceae bacterium]